MVSEQNKGNAPIYEDKEKNWRLAIFKNANVKGVKYPMICLTRYKFPFKYNQKITFHPNEAQSVMAMLLRLPKIEVDNSAKKSKV